MKTFLFVLLSLFCFCGVSQAQTKTTTIKVPGECGSCKKKIEGAAIKAGASYARWNMNTKLLTVRYNSRSTGTDKIEKSIAGVGYDTPDYPADKQAYDSLEECCKKH